MSTLLEQYRWAVDRLVEAFGEDEVVIADGADRGRTLAIGVRDPRNSQVLGFVVERPARREKGLPAVSLNSLQNREKVLKLKIGEFRARLAE